MPESPSIGARVRAGLARVMTQLSRVTDRLEEWAAHRTRLTVIALVAVVALAISAVLVATEGRMVAGWFSDGPPHARAHGGPPPKPDGHRPPKPDGKPAGAPDGRFAGAPDGKPEMKPHRPERPGQPPLAPPAPPEPPAAP